MRQSSPTISPKSWLLDIYFSLVFFVFLVQIRNWHTIWLWQRGCLEWSNGYGRVLKMIGLDLRMPVNDVRSE